MNFNCNYLQRPHPQCCGSPASVMAFPLTITCHGSQTDTTPGQQYTDFSVDRILGLNSDSAPSENTARNQPGQSQMCPPYMSSYRHFNEMPYTCSSPLYNGYWMNPWSGYSAVPRPAANNIGINMMYSQDLKADLGAPHPGHHGDDEISLITINDDSDGQEQLPTDFCESDEDSQAEIDSETVPVADQYLNVPETFEGVHTDFDDGVSFHEEAEEIDFNPETRMDDVGQHEEFTNHDDSFHVTRCHSDSTMEEDSSDPTQPVSPTSSRSNDDVTTDVDSSYNISTAHIAGPWRHEYLEHGKSPVLIHTHSTFRLNVDMSPKESPRTSEVGSVTSGAESLGTKCTKLFTEIDEYATYLGSPAPAANSQPEPDAPQSTKTNVENQNVDAVPSPTENMAPIPSDSASLEIQPEYNSDSATTVLEEAPCCSKTLPRVNSSQPDENNEPQSQRHHQFLKIVTHEMAEKILANLNIEFCASKLAPKRAPISKTKKAKAAKRLNKTEPNSKKKASKTSGKQAQNNAKKSQRSTRRS